MRAGQLRHRVAIQSLSVADDGGGGKIETWTTSRYAWADIEPMSGNEKYIADGLRTEVTHRLSVRGGTPVTTANRVLFGSRVFTIYAVLDNHERGILKYLLCKEIPA